MSFWENASRSRGWGSTPPWSQPAIEVLFERSIQGLSFLGMDTPCPLLPHTLRAFLLCVTFVYGVWLLTSRRAGDFGPSCIHTWALMVCAFPLGFMASSTGAAAWWRRFRLHLGGNLGRGGSVQTRGYRGAAAWAGTLQVGLPGNMGGAWYPLHPVEKSTKGRKSCYNSGHLGGRVCRPPGLSTCEPRVALQPVGMGERVYTRSRRVLVV